jgi:hypothetical protein
MMLNRTFHVVALCLFMVQEVVGDTITSKEYKAMMKPANFTGSTATVNTKLASLKTALASYATSQGRTSSGSFTLKSGMPRQVKFYDTLWCDIYNKGYAFRMRRDSGKTNWEGTLKFRNPSEAVTDTRRTKMNHCGTTDLGGKFQGDLSLGGSTVFAYSHDCEIADSKNINILDDVDDTWDEINQVWVNEFLWNLNNDIYKVNGMTISERVYSGFKVNFPGTVADFSVTIWYSSSTSTTPLLAELSFTTDADMDVDVNAFWGTFGTTAQLTSWLDASALFKTNWLYTQWGC